MKDLARSGWLRGVRRGNTEALAGCLAFREGEKWPSQPEMVPSEQLDPCLAAPRVYFMLIVLSAQDGNFSRCQTISTDLNRLGFADLPRCCLRN